MLSTVQEAYFFWIYGNGRPMEVPVTHIMGAQIQVWDSYSIFWEQEWHINTFAFNNNFSILGDKINYVSTTVVINYVWFHPLCVSDLLLNWFSGMNCCHCSLLFAEKRNMKHLFFLCKKFKSLGFFSNCYIFICHLFSVFFHDFL